ncbi:hypothetical protein NLG97_g116 [Lecanicillium saksenae]|uniref:Uncharacterized protein n=1 Tax=Lecanicillium saksenae TaxID=468837 RepID=A0ACC1R7R3_9HYPO|nr:hypothetical protein NLG97_g116 [Lecanicillium saksenae]
MPKRKASEDTSRGHKRHVPIALTVLELRSLLDPYKDEDSADIIFKDKNNHDTLQRLYESLCRRFTVKHKPDGLRTKGLDSIKASNLKIPISVSSQFSNWDQDPHRFWWPEPSPSAAPKEPQTTDGYRQRFVMTAIEQSMKLQVQKVVGRFTSIAMYLSFRRFMGCDITQDIVASCKSIITAGKRRITICDELVRRSDSIPQPGPSQDTTTANDECQNRETGESVDDWCREPNSKYYKRTLGICFLDIIPDSICDEGKSLRKGDLDASIEALHSIKALAWLADSKTESLANRLLDYQHKLLWATHGPVSAGEGSVGSIAVSNQQLQGHRNFSTSGGRSNWVESTSQAMAQPAASGMLSLLTAARMAQTPENGVNSTSWCPRDQVYSMPLPTSFHERPFDGYQSIRTNDATPAETNYNYFMDMNQIDWFSGSNNIVGDTNGYAMQQPASFDMNATCETSSMDTQSVNYHIDAGFVNWFSVGGLQEVVEQ